MTVLGQGIFRRRSAYPALKKGDGLANMRQQPARDDREQSSFRRQFSRQTGKPEDAANSAPAGKPPMFIICLLLTTLALAYISGCAGSQNKPDLPLALAVPTLSTGTGSVILNNDINETLTCTNSATACYTTDGTDPAAITAGTCSAGTTYSTPFAVGSATGMAVKAICTKAGFNNSPQNPATTVTLTSATPTYNNDSGTHNTNPVTVTITDATTGSTIKYCTGPDDTCDPNSGTVYSSPVSITVDGTYLRSIATRPGYNPSAVKSAKYTLSNNSATPTLVQYAEHPVLRFGTTTHWKIPLPNPSPGGNLGILACAWGSGTDTPTSVVDDKGNVWSSAKISPPSNDELLGVFYYPNLTAGTRVITITWPNAEPYTTCHAFEFKDVATSSPLDGTPAGQEVTSTNRVTSGSFNTTQDGDLIFQVAVCADCGTTAPESFTPGSGLTLLGADGYSGFADQYQIQPTHGATNPALTWSPNVNAALSVTVAFKALAAGNSLPAGIRACGFRAMDMPEYVGTTTPAAIAVQTPMVCGGNLIAVSKLCQTSCASKTITSSPSNTWTQDASCAAAGATNTISWSYAANASVSSTMTMSFATSDTDSFAEFGIFEISGAATAPFDKCAVGQNSDDRTVFPLTITGPSITPATANGLILGYQQEDQQSVTGVSPGYFASVEVGVYEYLDLDQDGGWMLYYNLDTSPLQPRWTYSDYEGSGLSVAQWESTNIAFEAPPAAAVSPIGNASTDQAVWLFPRAQAPAAQLEPTRAPAQSGIPFTNPVRH